MHELVGQFAVSRNIDPVEPESGEEAARLFGARQSVEYLSLSPSGTKIAYIAPHRDSGEILYVVDLEGDPMPRAIASNSEPKPGAPILI